MGVCVKKTAFWPSTSLNVRPHVEECYFLTLSSILMVIIWNFQGSSLQRAASTTVTYCLSIVQWSFMAFCENNLHFIFSPEITGESERKTYWEQWDLWGVPQWRCDSPRIEKGQGAKSWGLNFNKANAGVTPRTESHRPWLSLLGKVIYSLWASLSYIVKNNVPRHTKCLCTL